MASRKMAIFCIYPDRTSLEYAISALKVAGFHDEDISVVLQADSQQERLHSGKSAKGTEEAGSIAGFAGETGPALKWLTEPKAIRIPGGGTILISGPLFAILKDSESLKNREGLIGSLLSFDLPERQVTQYMGRLKEGGILFSVYCHQRGNVVKARAILGFTGAEVICTTRNRRAEAK